MVRPFLATVIVSGCFLLGGKHAHGQSPPPTSGESRGIGGIVGFVRDSAGVGINGAQLTVAGIIGRGHSGADGSFRLIGVTAGSQLLIVRRIGFRPDSQFVTVIRSANIEVEVRLAPAPGRLGSVVVEGTRTLPSGRLRGFYERRQRGLGTFFTADEIERRNPALVSDLLRSVPSIQVVRRSGTSIVTFRGSRCTPLVWVDGSPATAGYFDPDVLSPMSLVGIEIYPGPATVPAELMMLRGRGSCGVIALWSREPPPRSSRPRSSDSTGRATSALPVYTVDEVEVAAVPDTIDPVVSVYPDSLLRARVTGRVLVEFVVDSAGAPEMGTFGVVSSTHPLFADAARRAVGAARFVPARREGRAVRQRVQLPFTFSIPGTE